MLPQQRHRSDNHVNNRLSRVLRDGKLVDELWHKVVVGDVIKMENDHFVAVRCVIAVNADTIDRLLPGVFVVLAVQYKMLDAV